MGKVRAPAAASARSERTRRAIVDALIDLIGAGEIAPTVDRVAAAAGVSVRSVYGHFGSVGELHVALIDRVTELVIERVEVIDPDEPLTVRVDLLCGQRARINEDLGPLLAAAQHHRARSEELDRSRRTARDASVAQIRRVFRRELSALTNAGRSRRVVTVDALLGLSTWTLLRTEHGLSVDQARMAVIEAVGRLVPSTTPPERAQSV